MDVINGGASIWEKGVITALTPEGTRSNLNGLNDAGEAVGAIGTLEGPQYAALWNHGVSSVLGPLPGFVNSEAHGINNRGQIVGLSVSFDATNDFRATLWFQGQTVDLGVLNGYTRSQAININDQGTIIGLSFLDRRIGATLWKDGQIHDLGGLPGFTRSYAMAINNRGQIVGMNTVPCPDCNFQHAVLWQGGVIFDLNSISSWDSGAGEDVRLVEATGINDNGEIIANGYNFKTKETAFDNSLPDS
ncbi:MAG: hypothetical protein AAB276_01115 [Pseudomonadota bacterium]